MKRILSIVISLAMLISISTSFALPLSAEGVLETTSESVTTAPEESPALPEATTTLPKAEDIMQRATDPVPEVTEPTPEVTDPTAEETEPDPVDDSASEDLPLTAGDIVASGYCGDSDLGDGTNLTWTLDSNGTLTISGEGKLDGYYSPFNGNKSITSVILNPGVTCIGNYAFSDCSSLTSVTIPNSVTSIGDYAFYYCKGLTSITIPNSVTSIGDYAFYGCWYLTSVTISNSVTCIGNYVFYGCYSLISVKIPSSVTSIGDYAFSGCWDLTSVTIPNSVTSIGIEAFNECAGLTSVKIPSSVTSIGDRAFFYCISLRLVTISDGVTTIGASAFSCCSALTSIIIPNSVTSIGNYALNNCTGLTSIKVDNNNSSYCSLDGVLFSKDKTELICYPAGKKDISYSIPNSVTRVCSLAFSYCIGLTLVTIPSSVTSIGNDAFYECIGLTSVTIPDSIAIIDENTFNGCTSLTSVIISSSVTRVDNGAFDRCSNLTSFMVDSDNSTYCSIDGVLFSKDGTKLIRYPAGKIDTSYRISDGVTGIADYAFDGCTCLTDVIIPDSVTSMGYGVFKYCDALIDIFCEAESAPSGWSNNGWGSGWFSGCTANVYWGYNPIDDEDLPEQETPPHGFLDIYHAGIAQTNDYSDFRPIQYLQLPDQTPSEMMNGYVKATKAEMLYNTWTTTTKLIDSVTKDPSLGIRYLTVDKVDMYTAIIMDSLEESMKNNALSKFKDRYSVDKNVTEAVFLYLKTNYNYEKNVTIKEIRNLMHGEMSETVKKDILTTLESEFREITPGGDFIDISKFSDAIFKYMDFGLDTLETFSDVLTSTVSYVNLLYLSEETIDLLHEMKDECTGNRALKEALNRCCDVIDEGTSKITQYNIITVGMFTTEQVMTYFWKSVKTVVEEHFPVVIIVLAAYKASKLIAKFTVNFDAISEAYYKMYAVLEYEELVETVYRNRIESFNKEQSVYNAKMYLAAADLLLQTQVLDTDYAINFCSEHRKSAMNIIFEWFREQIDITSFADVEEQFGLIKSGLQYRNILFNNEWSNLITRDYPEYAAYYKEAREDANKKLFKAVRIYTSDITGNPAYMYSLSADRSPSLNAYCYDESDNLVAYVENGICHAEGNVSFVYDGENIDFAFYDDQNYRIVTNGSAGAIDINVTEYADNEVVNEVNYIDIPMNQSSEYSLTSVNNAYILKDNSDVTHTPAYDSSIPSQKYKLTVNGGFATAGGDTDTELEVCAGQVVEITAYVPSGKDFMGWSADGVFMEFDDETAISTSFVMPAIDVSVIANIEDEQNHVHTVVVDAELPPTSTTDGHTAGTHCSVCGDILSGNEIIPKTNSDYLPGDVNNDGKLNNQDAIHLLKHVMNHDQYAINQNGDMNNDGKVNNQDAIYLLKHILNPASYPLRN